jgi:hypothetical protein
LGLLALWSGGPIIRLAIVLYGAGVGLESIARGTLPLAVFGAVRYPIIMGQIAMPNLFTQAAAPAIGAALLAAAGLDAALALFAALALCNVLVAATLFLVIRQQR